MGDRTFEFFRYLPVSKKDRDWGLFVTGAGRVVDGTPDYTFSKHPPPYYSTWDKGWVRPHYEIAYVIRGQGEFESEVAGAASVHPGDAILTFPRVWY